MAARRIWRDVANVVWYYITHLQAEINNRAAYIYTREQQCAEKGWVSVVSDYRTPQTLGNRRTTVIGVGNVAASVQHYCAPTSVVPVAPHMTVADTADVGVEKLNGSSELDV